MIEDVACAIDRNGVRTGMFEAWTGRKVEIQCSLVGWQLPFGHLGSQHKTARSAASRWEHKIPPCNGSDLRQPVARALQVAPASAPALLDRSAPAERPPPTCDPSHVLPRLRLHQETLNSYSGGPPLVKEVVRAAWQHLDSPSSSMGWWSVSDGLKQSYDPPEV
ncbi:hypothetical protein C8Q80DRAFT_1123387 [Daedaleopsis nitida]|nr:hypothetical protein C8Q80DRAFT_1123387 [Daedaleopsis nitida]